MKDGLIRAAAVSPMIRVADVETNGREILRRIQEAEAAGVKLLLFPELALTGVSCMDLFRQQALLSGAEAKLFELLKETEKLDILVALGLPVSVGGRVYSAVAFFTKGELLALVPKTLISGKGSLMQTRVFAAGPEKPERILMKKPDGEALYPLFGRRLFLTPADAPSVKIGVIFAEELGPGGSDGTEALLSEAQLLLCPGNEAESAGGRRKRRALLEAAAGANHAALLYAGPSQGESTEDNVWSAHSLIIENGVTLAESPAFSTELICTELDTELLDAERSRAESLPPAGESFLCRSFRWDRPDSPLTRCYPAYPFRPEDPEERRVWLEEVLSLQAMGLRKRLEHTGLSRVLIGVSGGLDSTWALLVSARAFDYLGLDRSRITAVTMPCFGTSERTYRNALTLADSIGAELLEINIKNAVRAHFEDIGQDEAKKDVAYENSQARERTQVLMDLANRLNGLVVGTGDLSELALGWATYNGDHMSNYGVNGSVPKTLMRDLVRWYGEQSGDEELRRVLFDILDTPVSPELLPAEAGRIAQKTEDLVGPYELHDFFLYYLLRYGFRPSKLFRMAKRSWGEEYGDETILRWLRTFCRRFLAQQFKRSCLPDGPCVTGISLSPRGAAMLPSDASAAMLLKDLEEISL